MDRIYAISLWVVSILMLLLGSSGTVSAEESAPDKVWSFDAALYFWEASIGGKSASGSDIDIKLDDVLDSLEFAVMGTARVRRGRSKIHKL